jgi:hypothetical protein
MFLADTNFLSILVSNKSWEDIRYNLNKAIVLTLPGTAIKLTAAYEPDSSQQRSRETNCPPPPKKNNDLFTFNILNAQTASYYVKSYTLFLSNIYSINV